MLRGFVLDYLEFVMTLYFHLGCEKLAPSAQHERETCVLIFTDWPAGGAGAEV